MHKSLTILCCCVCIFAAKLTLGAELQLLPADFVLHGPQGSQQLSATTIRDSRAGATLSSDRVELTSSDPAVVRIQDGVAHAVGNGEAQISVRGPDGATATASVRVVGAEKTHSWSFRHDVESIFSKVGCNSGACHGALAGKGGFRLSLRGYDPTADYLSITREARGRRIELGRPAASLILAKPTGAVPHKGGLKLTTDSRNYQILAKWLAQGAKAPVDDDPQLERISVLPASAMLRPGESSQILVRAHYDDSRVVDVTHWARFSSTDESVVSVNENGKASVRGSGAGAVLVWFGSKVALARATVAFPNEIPAEFYATAPRRNFIDSLNLAQLETLALRPAPRCDDEAFLRRATLDVVGRLPTPAERETYLSQPSLDRRDRLIERLLASDDFADYWTYRWSDVLTINGNRLPPAGVKSYYDWIHESVQENKPWNQFVHEIITAVGASDQQGEVNFYSLNQSPEEMTENACQAFLGLSIGCAKCHNHPLEKWTNDQYYAMANLFARVRAKGWGGDGRDGDGLRTLYVSTSGELLQPKTGKPQPPAPLDAPPLEFDDKNDRRLALAEWMTGADNPYFARAVANRIWGNFFGRGLVEPVDDLRLSNPASNEPLLDAIAEYLVDAQYDLKQLMRTILQSETYQRSSIAHEQNRDDQKYHSRYYPKRLMAEVMLDAIDQVLGTTTKFSEVVFRGSDRRDYEFYQEGARAIELYDSAVDSYFLKTFGRNPRDITCECERSNEPSMVQVLHLSNGDTLNPKLADANNQIAAWIAAEQSSDEIVTALFVRALAREPTESELKTILNVVAEYEEDRGLALQDAAWGLLTSPEFTFNH